jgi:hypothetical protein
MGDFQQLETLNGWYFHRLHPNPLRDYYSFASRLRGEACPVIKRGFTS